MQSKNFANYNLLWPYRNLHNISLAFLIDNLQGNLGLKCTAQCPGTWNWRKSAENTERKIDFVNYRPYCNLRNISLPFLIDKLQGNWGLKCTALCPGTLNFRKSVEHMEKKLTTQVQVRLGSLVTCQMARFHYFIISLFRYFVISQIAIKLVQL